MILVIGQTRTGTSLAMQMLQAAGCSCVGDWPAFEHDDLQAPKPDFSVIGRRAIDAGKLVVFEVPPLAVGIPPWARVIVTARDPRVRAESDRKFFRHMFGFDGYAERHQRRRLVDDTRRVQRGLIQATRDHDVHPLVFEDLIGRPRRTAERLVAWLGRGEPERLAACVVPRPATCYDGMLEVELMQQRDRGLHAAGTVGTEAAAGRDARNEDQGAAP